MNDKTIVKELDYYVNHAYSNEKRGMVPLSLLRAALGLICRLQSKTEPSNACVRCGKEVPEGRQVCPNCEAEVKSDDID